MHYIAMNRFHVPTDNAQAFEDMWLNRKSSLHEHEGFVSFDLLKGAESDGLVLFISHTVWSSEDAFVAWTQSPQFRGSHKNAGSRPKLHEGTNQFEGLVSRQHISA